MRNTKLNKETYTQHNTSLYKSVNFEIEPLKKQKIDNGESKIIIQKQTKALNDFSNCQTKNWLTETPDQQLHYQQKSPNNEKIYNNSSPKTTSASMEYYMSSKYESDRINTKSHKNINKTQYMIYSNIYTPHCNIKNEAVNFNYNYIRGDSEKNIKPTDIDCSKNIYSQAVINENKISYS